MINTALCIGAKNGGANMLHRDAFAVNIIFLALIYAPQAID